MKMNLLWILVFGFHFLPTLAQQPRFVVNIVHIPRNGNSVFRCSAFLVTNQHVVTAASCVIVDPSFEVGVQEVTESTRSE